MTASFVAGVMCLGLLCGNGGQDLLALADVHGGLIVHVGCGDGELTLQLAAGPQFVVQGLETSPASVAAARQKIRKAGSYGRVTVVGFDGKRLPYNDNLVRLLVVEKQYQLSDEELLRVACPGGVILKKTGDGWQRTVKDWPKDIDQWTHFLHGPDNNAVAQDTRTAAPRGIQWVGKPLWSRSHEQLASMSVAVSANGRLFYIVDLGPLESLRFPARWFLIARDAFSGVILWQKPISVWIDHLRHFRSGPVHLQRRLVAVGDDVFATLSLGQPVVRLDAATGRLVQTYKGTDYTEEILVADGTLYLAAGSSEVIRRGGPGLFTRGEPEPNLDRRIMAIDIDSGRVLWVKHFSTDDYLLPMGLAVGDGKVFYKATATVGCLDAKTGKQLWAVPADTPLARMAFSGPTLVYADGVLLCADRVSTPETQKVETKGRLVVWGVDGWNIPGIPRQSKCLLVAYDASNGKKLWQAPCSETYNSPVDVFVVGNTVWVGADYHGYDLHTGEDRGPLNWRGAQVGMSHHRCYRNKATLRYLFTGRSGVEVVSFEKGWICNNSWIRGTCQYGIMPANGLIYAPPDACACFNLVKVPGFFAATTKEGGIKLPPPTQDRLEKGPAYGRVNVAEKDDPTAWPTLRANAARGAAVKVELQLPLSVAWQAKLGGKLSQATAAYGKVFVADSASNTLYALDEQTGQIVWDFTADGPIDSPPTLYKGLAIFGCRDGRVYCLRAEDGQLVWRFRVAPDTRQVVAFGQLESVWPVNGSVLVQNDSVYAVAGRSSYLDGGLTLVRLDPVTGQLLNWRILYHLDPETGRQIGWEDRRRKPFDMEGTRADVLSGDGTNVFLKHFCFDAELNDLPQPKPHLISVAGFLVQDWFVRAYWLIATEVGTGWGQWNRMGNLVPAGWIVCFDDQYAYGYGRKFYGGGPAGHTTDACHLYAARLQSSAPTLRTKRKSPSQLADLDYRWRDENCLTVKAMAVAGDKLVLAGPPDYGPRAENMLVFVDQRRAIETYLGKNGVFLQVRSTEDGKVLATYKLPALPRFDGLAVAHGRIFVTLQNGTLLCFE